MVAGSIPAGGTTHLTRSTLTFVTHNTPETNDQRFVVFIRGINVGGKSSVPMAQLRELLLANGFTNVITLLNSGNVVLQSSDSAQLISTRIETLLGENFSLEPNAGGTHVLSGSQLRKAISNAPQEFGTQPEKYHSDVIFLMGIDSAEAIAAFTPREGVDTIWAGDGVIYSQRLSTERTKSRLNRVMQLPLYKSMTIRTWNTVLKIDAATHPIVN